LKVVPTHNKNIIDNFANKAGHVFARLPPYHCSMTVIRVDMELGKGYIVKYNKNSGYVICSDWSLLHYYKLCLQDGKLLFDNIIKVEGRVCELGGH
jgi:hypothetical protein